ncbi:hypothetical protein [Sulfurisoma sediminicola]|uniref:Uncharacterized protein n=1 Tax=Sulfurisoma sediminicola TaxID=1381557 RepID=A0A497XF24_9PROT|nr:hypothetical protein [Sulfurisoma sediminicola]RLJ65145.1 hypothetical protein DFR35_1801 [Sulfurisoma sediminicola]
MSDPNFDAGMAQVIVERLQSQRLPRALVMKEKVDRGELLDDYDLSLLQEVLKDSSAIRPLVDAHPEWQELASKMSNLYKEIAEKGLENAKKAGG